jgi:hypothetical protein
MIRHGKAPFLECSTRGDQRFSAFCARIKGRDNKSIEEIYQAAKVFIINGKPVTDLPWWEAKGRRANNMEELAALYGQLWDEYIAENPELVAVLKAASGLQDFYGQIGHQCQATELWRIRNETRI